VASNFHADTLMALRDFPQLLRSRTPGAAAQYLRRPPFDAVL